MREAKWWRRNGLLLGALVAGGVLRFYQLKEQIIADDEWHAVNLARDSAGFTSIASHFGEADVSIPIALFYRVVMITFGLSEWIMRAPVVFFGLLSLVIFPLLVRKVFDPTTAALFAWLLAISPMHIYYSRYARPYSISLFYAFCGICAFHFWQTTRDRRWKWLYVVCAIVGPYFHLSVLPVLVAPLTFVCVLALCRRSDDFGPSRTEIVRLILFAGGGLATLLLPPIYWDYRALADKAGHGTLTSYSLGTALELLLGMDARLLEAITLAIMMLGAFFVVRRQPSFGVLLGTSAGVAILTILIARPMGIEYPIVVARYALFLLPVLLLLVAAGLHAIGGWMTGMLTPAAVMIGVAWMVLTLLSGTIPKIYYFPNNFTNHGAFQYYPTLDGRQNPYIRDLSRPISPFYRALGQQPVASLRIVEAPWYFEWAFNPYPIYQRIHRQRVAIGFVRPEAFPIGEAGPFDPRFRLHNAVHLQDMGGLCAHKIDRVVLHKDLEVELGRPLNRNFSKELPALIAQYQQAYGTPVFEDASLIVFDTSAHCVAHR
jgi:hypothetical protein